MKSFLREEALFAIRENRQKGCQLHLTEYVLQDVFP